VPQREDDAGIGQPDPGIQVGEFAEKSKDTRFFYAIFSGFLLLSSKEMGIVTHMARALLCPMKGHAWTTAGLCKRCEKPCSHAVTVFDPQTGIEKCLVCGFLRAQSQRSGDKAC
jgi:hypothetical protein